MGTQLNFYGITLKSYQRSFIFLFGFSNNLFVEINTSDAFLFCQSHQILNILHCAIVYFLPFVRQSHIVLQVLIKVTIIIEDKCVSVVLLH